jgi:hypothetical protein
MNTIDRQRLPEQATIVIVLAAIAVLSIGAGGLSTLVGISDHSSEASISGIGAFLFGWLLTGFCFALRKVQLIEWRIARPSGEGNGLTVFHSREIALAADERS